MSIKTVCQPDEDGLLAWKSHNEFPAFFKEEVFSAVIETDYPSFCNLQNENFFKITTFPSLACQYAEASRIYASLEPALKLASRIILDKWSTFCPLVQPANIDVNGVQSSFSQDAIIFTIKRWIPNIEFTEEECDKVFGVVVSELPNDVLSS